MSATSRSGEDTPSNVSAIPDRPRLGTFAALAVRDYRVLWLAMLAWFTAGNMQQVAQGFLVYQLSGSATVLGLVGLAYGLPQVVLGLFGGVVADRVSKRLLLVLTQVATGLIALATAVLVLSGTIEVWHLYVLSLLQGSVFAFNMPARQAFVAQLVSRERLMNAVALSNAAFNATAIAGPALAGLLIALPFAGIAGAFFLIAACFVASAGATLRISVPGVALAQERSTSPAADLWNGVRYVTRDPTLRMLLFLAFVVSCLGYSYQTFLPVFAGPHVLDIGATGLGLLTAAGGVGALAGCLAVASLSGLRRQAFLQLLMAAAFGLTLVALGLARQPLTAVLVLVLVGLTANFFMSLNNTLLVTHAEPRFYGRVMSVYMLSFSCMLLAGVPLGGLVDLLGAPLTMLLAGVAIAAITAGITIGAPDYRRSLARRAAPAQRTP